MCIVAVSFAFWFRFVLSLRTMCIIACFVRQIAEATPDLNVHNKCTSRQRTEFNLFIAISMNFAEIYVNQMVCSLPFSFPFFHFCFRTGHTSSTDNALIIDFWRIAFAVFVCHFDFRERTQRANKIVARRPWFTNDVDDACVVDVVLHSFCRIKSSHATQCILRIEGTSIFF